MFTGDVAILDDWIAQQEVASDKNDLMLIFMKFNRKGQWIAYPQGLAFEVERKLPYKKWYFCSWDEFWNKTNIALVKKLASKGIKC